MELLQHDSRLSPEVDALISGDTATVQAIFDGLTDEQRHHRFHVPTPVLPPAMRRRLADVDGDRHVALVLRIGGRPVGLARYVVTGLGEAEFAIAIVSEFAHRGYGTGLLEELMAHAHRRGVTRLSFEFMANNQPARQLAERHGATFRLDGSKYHGVLPTEPSTSTGLPQAAAG